MFKVDFKLLNYSFSMETMKGKEGRKRKEGKEEPRKEEEEERKQEGRENEAERTIRINSRKYGSFHRKMETAKKKRKKRKNFVR